MKNGTDNAPDFALYLHDAVWTYFAMYGPIPTEERVDALLWLAVAAYAVNRDSKDFDAARKMVAAAREAIAVTFEKEARP